jgi:hypothetical protein
VPSIKYPKTWIQEIQARFVQGKYGKPYVYKGRTTDATQTELFIEGKTNRRLYLPKAQGAGVVYITGMAYNLTDGNGMTNWNRAAIAFERLANGTFQLANGVDLDGAGTENNPLVIGTAATAAVMIRSGASANGLALDVQGITAADDPFIRIRVTGQAAKTILWRFEAEPHYIAYETEQSLTEGV